MVIILFIINSIAIIKFFFSICKTLFVSLLAIGKVEKGLLRLILNYFAIIKTNKHRIFYFYYLILLKKIYI